MTDAKLVFDTIVNHEDFISQMTTIADMGSGDGTHSKWWSSISLSDGRTINPVVLAVDDTVQIDNRNRAPNVRQISTDWDHTNIPSGKVDLIWCHDSFQFSTNPFQTLSHWYDVLNDNGMLVLSVPQTAYIDDLSRWQIEHKSGCYHSWNIVNLIYTLATSGFDCRDGFLRMRRHDPFIWAAVYKSPIQPMNPRTTSWYELAEKKLIPESAIECVNLYGYLKHEFLDLRWIDKQNFNVAIESIP